MSPFPHSSVNSPFFCGKKKHTVLESTFIISFILTSCYSNENESLHKVNSPFCLIIFFYILFFFLAALFSFPSSQLHAFSKAHQGNICVHSCLLNYALCFFFFITTSLVFGEKGNQAEGRKAKFISNVISSPEIFSVYELQTLIKIYAFIIRKKRNKQITSFASICSTIRVLNNQVASDFLLIRLPHTSQKLLHSV